MLKEIVNIVSSLPSQHVIYGLISVVLCLATLWVYAQCSKNIRYIILEAISYLVIINELVFQVYMLYYGIWSLKTSLPLEMCYISALLIPVYLKNHNSRALKTWFYFAGFCGSLFAFINTNLSEVEHIYVSIHYFIAHGIVIFLMLSILVDGYRPVWRDYFNAIIWTFFLVIIVVVLNLLFDSNYMFTFQKPEGVNFTLLMPGWPYYFLIMLLIGLVSYTVMMLLPYLIKYILRLRP